jgi:hypothetical protein
VHHHAPWRRWLHHGNRTSRQARLETKGDLATLEV